MVAELGDFEAKFGDFEGEQSPLLGDFFVPNCERENERTSLQFGLLRQRTLLNANLETPRSRAAATSNAAAMPGSSALRLPCVAHVSATGARGRSQRGRARASLSRQSAAPLRQTRRKNSRSVARCERDSSRAARFVRTHPRGTALASAPSSATTATAAARRRAALRIPPKERPDVPRKNEEP